MKPAIHDGYKPSAYNQESPKSFMRNFSGTLDYRYTILNLYTYQKVSLKPPMRLKPGIS